MNNGFIPVQQYWTEEMLDKTTSKKILEGTNNLVQGVLQRCPPLKLSFTVILKRPPPETDLTSNLEHQCSSRCLVIKNQYYNQWNLPKS